MSDTTHRADAGKGVTLPALLALALAVPAAALDWDGSCGTTNWHTCCNLGGDPPVFDNNWDRGTGPDCPPYPGESDNVLLGPEVVLNGLVGGPITIQSLVAGGTFTHSQNLLTVTGNAQLGDYTLVTSGLVVEGELVIDGPFNWRGGSLRSGHPIAVNGPLTLRDFTSTLDASTLVASGPVAWTGGAIQLVDATLRVEAPMTATTDAPIQGTGDPSVESVEILQSFTKRDSAGETRVHHPVSFNVLGTVSVQSGMLRLEGGGLSAGAWTSGIGTTVRFNSSNPPYRLEPGASLRGDGVYRNTSQLHVAEGATVPVDKFDLAGGAVAGPGTLEVNDTFNWLQGTLLGEAGAAGGPGELVVTGSGTMNVSTFRFRVLDRRVLLNRGHAFMSVDTWIQFRNGGVLDNRGVFEILDDTTYLKEEGGSGVFRNAGTVIKQQGALPALETEIEVPFENTGTLSVRDAAILNLLGGGFSSGPILMDVDATLFIRSRVFALRSGATVSGGILWVKSGTLRMEADAVVDCLLMDSSSAVLDGPGTVTVPTCFGWRSGRLAGDGATITTGLAQLGVAESHGTLTLNRRLSNVGELTWLRRNIDMFDGAMIDNLGSFSETSADDACMCGTGDARFNNKPGGTFEKTAESTGETIVQNVAFTNDGGSVVSRAGVLRFTTEFVQTSGSVRTAGGRIIFDLPTNIDGGRVEGQSALSDLVGDLNNRGGTLGPGSSAGGDGPGAPGSGAIGSLVLTGAYAQEAEGAMEIDVAGIAPGTGHDEFVATGPAALDGALRVRLADGFAPALGDAFTIVRAASVSGAFASLDAPALGPNLAWEIAYGADDVVLRIVERGVHGDVNGDGVVGFADLLEVLAAWGPCPDPPDPCPADLDDDGVVGFADLLIVLANWS